MTFIEAVGAVVALAIITYLTARLVTAAYFRSKEDHERKRNGKNTTQHGR